MPSAYETPGAVAQPTEHPPARHRAGGFTAPAEACLHQLEPLRVRLRALRAGARGGEGKERRPPSAPAPLHSAPWPKPRLSPARMSTVHAAARVLSMTDAARPRCGCKSDMGCLGAI